MINIPTMEQLNKLPRLYETENICLGEKIVHLHFTADRCHWWAIEWDDQDTFFGHVLLNEWNQEAKFGYFNLSELLDIKVWGWLEVLNNPFWIPKPMKEIALIPKTFRSQDLFV